MSNESVRSSNSDTEPDIEIMDAEESLVERVPKAPAMLRLGRYRIVCELASGGMATVNLAVADGLDKLLALKVIHPHLAKEEPFVRMFLDEARIASSVSHRNVCNVFDYGEQDGSYYMAMDYLAGSTLRDVMQRLRAKRGSQEGAKFAAYIAYIIAQACEGLHAAHELRGNHGELLDVVHRDVSPHNLFVTYDGNVSVVDFGIARASDRLQQTATGVLKGKFSYMAPEQIRQTNIDRRADIWALGVCLWEALTQRRLFVRGTQADTLMSVMMDPIKPPSELAAGIPPELDAIVLRALARNPDERYRTAREMGRDLTAFCRETGISIGNVEIEQFMQELFPKEIVQSRDLMRRAKRAAQDENEIYLGGPSPTHSGAVLRPTLQRALAGGTNTGSYSANAKLGPARATTVPAEQKSRSRGFVWGAVCAGLISAGFFIGLQRSESTAPQTAPLALRPAEQPAPPAPAASAPAQPPAPTLQPMRAPEPIPQPVAVADPAGPTLAGPSVSEASARLVPQSGRNAIRQPNPRQRAHEIVEAAQAETGSARGEQRAAAAAVESEAVDSRPDAAPPAAQEPRPVSESAAPAPAHVAEPTLAKPQATSSALASKPSTTKPDSRPLDASVSFGEIQTVGSLGSAVVSRMLNRTTPLLRSCYQSAARAAQRNDFSPLTLSFTIDESGGLRGSKASAHSLPSLSGCAADTLKRVRADQKPDVGTVKVQVQVSFRSL